MAFNLQVFRVRALTAVIFAAVMLLGILWNAWSFIILFSVIHFGCWWEFIKLMKLIDPNNFITRSLWGILYITLPCLMMIDLGMISYTGTGAWNGVDIAVFAWLAYVPIAIIASIWINDTMAYLVGSWLGKTPLTKISPKKTWEGTIGGIFLSVLVISGVAYFSQSMTVKDAAIISASCAVFGTIGDLLESKIKRMAGVKDSGRFMPGHGGFLDRFDSLLLAVPCVWIYIHFLLQ
ncbi:MAG: phosphatidate cytidylyltransferase [Terrimonas sp.]|nr:phosphatidate cytidylyltransferase [Terrimonas sp.]